MSILMFRWVPSCELLDVFSFWTRNDQNTYVTLNSLTGFFE